MALLSPVAQAAMLAGQVIVASGEVTAITPQGESRPLARKSEFYSGEILKTGADSRAQVKFIDNALLSLKPNTELRVDDYRFDSANKDNNASVMTLLKGGLRTITGVISKQKPEAYRINTPVASIGVRGTDLELTLDESGLKVCFWGGSGFALNETGPRNLGADTPDKCAQIPDAITVPKVFTPVLPDEARFSDAVSDKNQNGVSDVIDKGTPVPPPPSQTPPPTTPPPQTPPPTTPPPQTPPPQTPPPTTPPPTTPPPRTPPPTTPPPQTPPPTTPPPTMPPCIGPTGKPC